MRSVWIYAALAAGLALAGCSKAASDSAALTKSCVEAGEKEATCGCITKAMAEKLSPELFTKTANAMGREKREVVAYIQSLPLEEQVAFAAIQEDLRRCALEDAASP